jgi:hypothetical protein
MKKTIYLLLFVLISSFLILYSCDSNPSETPAYPPGSVTGRVLDSATHKPLAGVYVSSNPITFGCLTDTSGRYTLTGIPMGTSAMTAYIIYSRVKYINDTIGVTVSSYDTSRMPDVRLIPTNGVFVGTITIQQYDYPESYSSLELDYLLPVMRKWFARDLDLMDSANAFRFWSSELSPTQPKGFITRLSSSVGNYTKDEFDTLAMYYGAREPLTLADFPEDRTRYFYTPLTESPVYPFYLYGRLMANQNSPKIFGLLHIESTWLEPNNIFKVRVNVKINMNGQNFFITNNK